MIISSIEDLRLVRLRGLAVLVHPPVVAVTNGCFDLFHPGHLHLLKHVYSLCPYAFLFVLVNSDRSVRALKGEGRPVQDQDTRAAMVDAVRYVAYTYVFDSERCDRELDILRPDIYIKGDDRRLEDLDPGERAVLEKHATRIILLPRMKGCSTTNIITKGA
jgi:rfaE bifunctional protein nucleotidyltransferase chain/domain